MSQRSITQFFHAKGQDKAANDEDRRASKSTNGHHSGSKRRRTEQSEASSSDAHETTTMEKAPPVASEDPEKGVKSSDESHSPVQVRKTAPRIPGDKLRPGIRKVLKAQAGRNVIISDSSDEDDEVDQATKEKKEVENEQVIDSPKVEDVVPGDISVPEPEKQGSKSEIKESKTTKDKPSKSSTQIHPFFGMKTVASVGKKSDDPVKPYDPAKSKYDPVKDASWSHSEPVPFLALAMTFNAIERESSRLRIIEILSNYIRSCICLSPDDLIPSIYLCLNRLAPAFEDLELGIAETGIIKAVAESTGSTSARIKSEMVKLGDLGVAAEQCRSKQKVMFKSPKLTVRGVFQKLVEIAKSSGKSAMKTKINKIVGLIVACRDVETKFLVRSLLGKLRIGLAEQSLLQALAVACTKTPPLQEFPPSIIDASAESSEAYKKKVERNAVIIKTAYCECPDYGRLVPALLTGGVDSLPTTCHLTPGVPLKPMLAQPTRGINEIVQRFEGSLFTCEWKYDGERAQIHQAESGAISIFSRNQENNSTKYPDVATIMKKVVGSSIESYILDCEVVAWDLEKNQILPFQVLSTRKKKNVSESDIKVQVCIFAFDLLYFNGQPLVKEPLTTRRQLLRDNFKLVDNEFQFAKSMDTNVIEEIQLCLDESIRGSCEGLMVKTLEQDATYEIARRSKKWLKLKKDYMEGIGDTIDVVVIGGFNGQGKRAGTYGGFLLAIYDPNAEEFQSLCKIGTGFSDEDLTTLSDFLKKHVIPEAKTYYRYDKTTTPDVWFDAVQVWEIKGADLTLSPVHYAARGLCGGDQRGISLRFPRFLRIRDDKTVFDATSAEQIAQMYKAAGEAQSSGSTSKTKDVEDDFY